MLEHPPSDAVPLIVSGAPSPAPKRVIPLSPPKVVTGRVLPPPVWGLITSAALLLTSNLGETPLPIGTRCLRHGI